MAAYKKKVKQGMRIRPYLGKELLISYANPNACGLSSVDCFVRILSLK